LDFSLYISSTIHGQTLIKFIIYIEGEAESSTPRLTSRFIATGNILIRRKVEDQHILWVRPRIDRQRVANRSEEIAVYVFFFLEAGGSRFRFNFGNEIPEYTSSRPRRRQGL